MQLHAFAPWNDFRDRDAFAVEIPGFDEPLAACFCGQGGGDPGLVLYRDGIAGLETVWRSDQFEDHSESIDQIGLLVAPLHTIAPPLRGLLTAARWRGRRETLAPFLLVKRPGKAPRDANRKEVRAALYAASAALEAIDSGTLELVPFDDPGGVPLLRLSGPPQAPHIEHDRLASVPRAGAPAPDDFRLRAVAHRLCPATWSVGLFTLTATIADDDRAVRGLVLADTEADQLLHTELVMGEGTNDAVATVLAYMDGETPDGTPQIPERLLCLNEALAERLALALSDHGVSCEYVPHQPALESMGTDLVEHMARDPSEEDDFPSLDDPELAPWRAAVQEVHELCSHLIGAHDRKMQRALKEYFGDAAHGRGVLDADDDDDYTMAFSNWLVSVYRARKNARTLVESVLKQGTAKGQARIAAEALQAARPSLFRIDDVAELHATVLDLASGERHRVSGPEWCDPELRTLTVPGILMHTGTHTLLLPIAPIFPDFMNADAFEELELNGIEFTPQALATEPDFAGVLATWFLRMEEEYKGADDDQDENFDLLGAIADELGLAVHKADFRMADPARALRDLQLHEGVSQDPKTGEYFWESEPEFQHAHSAPDLIARWDVVDDHLVVTCETVEAFESTRSMFEGVAGIELVDMHVEPFGSDDPDSGGVPMDDLLGIDELNAAPDGEPSAEQAEQFEEFQGQILFDWLARESPALGGLTPRQACETDAGARRVKFLIRTRPLVHPAIRDELIESLRREAFKELGLDA